MTPEQELHLTRIKNRFYVSVDAKYRAGQAQHGGDLFLKPGVIDMALEEAVDLYVYLATLKEQQEDEKNKKT